jgi:hypothetical protein
MNISTFAGNGGLGFSGDNVPATTTAVYGPQSVVVDENSNVYIADFLNKRILKVDVGTGLITTIAGSGTHGYSGDGGDATAADLGYVYNVAVDKCNNVYICDMDNHRVRKVTYASGPCYYNTGISDVVMKTQFNLYPNPANDQLNFSCKGKITSIEITDQLGRKLLSHDYSANEVSVNVSDLPPGVYVANVNHGLNRLFVKQ